MNKFLCKTTIASFLLAVCFSANAQKIESHCTKSEFIILTAKMGKLEKDKFIPNGKYLSLCSDTKKEPFSKFTYKYGKIGAIELEVVATPTSKFNLHHEMTGPRMSDNIVWFTRGNTTYLINEAMGMTSGVWLYVYQGKKKIAEITSGLSNENYDSDLGNVDMNKAKSPVFEIKNHGLQF
jgi:hypothetical protein